MNQRITSETFRYKFLNYNRAWLVAQLPSILTPRTLRRSRPYLITQFTKILGSVNPDISSDSQSDEDPDKPKFGPVALSAPSRNMIRMWLAQARRRRRLREVVQPIINQARKAQCEQCLSQRQLQVELVVPLEVLGDKFERESMSEEFDQVAWKEFFRKHAKFRTLCLECMLKRKEDERNAVAGMQGVDISGMLISHSRTWTGVASVPQSLACPQLTTTQRIEVLLRRLCLRAGACNSTRPPAITARHVVRCSGERMPARSCSIKWCLTSANACWGSRPYSSTMTSVLKRDALSFW